MSKNQNHYNAPVSIRLSQAERACLKDRAGAMGVSRYIRQQLLQEDTEPRQRQADNFMKTIDDTYMPAMQDKLVAGVGFEPTTFRL